MFTTLCPSPVGELLLASDGTSLIGLWLDGQKYYGAGLSLEEARELPVFTLARRWLEDYFSGRQPDPAALPLAPAGSPFRQAIWQLLREIPCGRTVTYGALAAAYTQRTGRPTSPRAVGGAVGHNPISIIIPCHRVVGADGTLTGYAGGIERKRFLLKLEGVDCPLG